MKFLYVTALLATVSQAACTATAYTAPSADYVFKSYGAVAAKCTDSKLVAAVAAKTYALADINKDTTAIVDKKAKAGVSLAKYLKCKTGFAGSIKTACTDAKATITGCTAIPKPADPTGKCGAKITAGSKNKGKDKITTLTNGSTVSVACKDGKNFGGAAEYKCVVVGANAGTWIKTKSCKQGAWAQKCPMPLKGVKASKATVIVTGGTEEGTGTKPTPADGSCKAGGDADPQCNNKDANNPAGGFCAKKDDTAKSAGGTKLNGMTCTLACQQGPNCFGTTAAQVSATWVADKKAAGSPASIASMMASVVALAAMLL